MAIDAIQVQNLTKKFGTKEALSDVSFSVPKGKIVGFLGPNGAGKTTAIRCIMGFMQPSSGSIKINGKDAHANDTEIKKIIGFLPSDLQLNPAWTVEDHLNLVEKIRDGDTKTKHLADLLGLNTKAKIKKLSTGNKQKLSIVLAFAGRPKILIMDEPTRGLDPVLQNVFYDILLEDTKRGNTVFFSSHNLAEVQRMCDIVILIKDGKIVTEQGMEQIREANSHIISAETRAKLNQKQLVALGAEITSFKDHHVEMKLRGPISPMMQYLAKQELLDLTTGHISLEDLFLEKYRD